MDLLKKYVDKFNNIDNEMYINEIDNANAYEWLKSEIPLFECPDKEIEEIYYFRWWTFRKHIKYTPEGYVITEFLPEVPWSGKYNAINAPVGHQIMEGRWLANSKVYFADYINFMLNNPETSHSYSAWLIYAVSMMRQVNAFKIDKELVEKMVAYYEEWERVHLLPNGMFWSLDYDDAMEFSISGTRNMKSVKGIRPTLNSYMCADALAISEFAAEVGMEETAKLYECKHRELKKLINQKLWDGDFYKAFHYDGDDITGVFDVNPADIPREEIGYIPWYFDISDKDFDTPLSYLESSEHFWTPYGITTAEQNHPDFLYEVDHACLWNGYVWPYATSQTITALIRICRANPDKSGYKQSLFRHIKDYAHSQYILDEEGIRRPWIDEVKHPRRDEWTSRSILKSENWPASNGGVERGKDYNHSTFCDLVISGIVGVDTDGKALHVAPAIPEDWDYFCLTNLHFNDKVYDIYYDKTGNTYGYKAGVTVICDGEQIK